MKRALLPLIFAVLAVAAFGQDTRIGLPAFGSFDQSPYDVINRQNLDTHITIPIANISGRGLPFTANLSYDSINWSNVSSSWSPDTTSAGASTWGWALTPTTGRLSYAVQTEPKSCAGGVGLLLTGGTFTDVQNVPHPFSALSSYCAKTGGWNGGSGYATDGSGYLVAIGTGAGTVTVTAPNGVSSAVAQLTSNPSFVTTVTDTNGNFVTGTTSNSVTTWTDTRGNAVAKIDNSVAGTTMYKVIDQTGTNTTLYTLSYTQYYIKTDFSCAGIAEYTSSSPVWLPTTLTLPDQQTYTFSYEQPSGYASNYTTGRLVEMVTPTGATYQYAYTGGGTSGVNCSDGTYTHLSRTITSNGTAAAWTFARAASGSNWNTTITYPLMPYDTTANEDVYTFSGTHEISHTNYQGASTALQTVTTAWDSTNTWPTQLTTKLPVTGWHKDTVISWSSYGQISSVAAYDWTTGSGLGTSLQYTSIDYESGSYPAYLTANMLSLPSGILVADSGTSGVMRSAASYTYDESGQVTSCPTGVPGHNDTNYGCSNGGIGTGSSPRGLVTTAQQWTTLSSKGSTINPIITKHTYDVFGNALTTSASNASLTTQTQQSSASYSLATEYSAPDSVTFGMGANALTTSYLYNQYTGAITQVTDPNQGVWQQSYEAAFFRPWITTRPDQKTITTSYDDIHRTATTVSPFDGPVTLTSESWADPLGRMYQTQSPTGTTQVSYDPLGRPYQVSVPYANGGSPSSWTATKYDALGRVLSTTTADGITSTAAYGSSSSAAYSVTSTDGAGHQRLSVIDGAGRISSVYEPDVTKSNSPLSVLTSYAYSSLNSLLSVTEGSSQTRTFGYDLLNRLASVTTPEAGTVTYTYDSCSYAPSNLCSATDARNVVTSYTYDTLNRMRLSNHTVDGYAAG